MSRFSIVPITIYHLQCTIHLFSSPPSQGGSGEGLFPLLTGHIAKIQNHAPGCQEASPFWRRFNTSRACHFSDEVLNNSSECSEESECASKKYYIADVYRFFGPLRMTRNGSSCLLAIFVPFNNCKIGICKDNSCFVQQGGGKGRTGAHTNAITVITDYR